MSTRVVAAKPGAAAPALTPDMSAIAGAIQKLPPLMQPQVVAAEVTQFAVAGVTALDQAKRAVIKTEADAGAAADMLRAIGKAATAQEAARKAKTAPADNYKQKLMDLYAVGKDTLAEAKKIFSDKLLAYQNEQAAIQRAEIAAREKLAQEEAARLAAAQAALGDDEGAEQILEEAAALPAEQVKVTVSGTFSTAGQRVRRVGTVTDTLAFLEALVANPLEEGYGDIINSIEIGPARLNALAALVLDKTIQSIPGFNAEEVTGLNVR